MSDEQPDPAPELSVANGRPAWLLGVALEAGLGVLAVAVGALIGFAPTATLTIDWAAAAAGVAATLPMLAGFEVFRGSEWPPLRRIRDELDGMVPTLFPTFSIAQMALVSLAAGLGEELLFRGLIQGLLDARLGGVAGLTIASLIFGLAHPVTRAYVAIATVIGAYLGALWMWTGSLLTPVVAHALYDFIALVAISRPLRLRAARPPHI